GDASSTLRSHVSPSTTWPRTYQNAQSEPLEPPQLLAVSQLLLGGHSQIQKPLEMELRGPFQLTGLHQLLMGELAHDLQHAVPRGAVPGLHEDESVLDQSGDGFERIRPRRAERIERLHIAPADVERQLTEE